MDGAQEWGGEAGGEREGDRGREGGDDEKADGEREGAEESEGAGERGGREGIGVREGGVGMGEPGEEELREILDENTAYYYARVLGNKDQLQVKKTSNKIK
jgi:hypothetical protein